MRGVLIRTGIGAFAVLAAFVFAVIWLDATVYTPQGFIETYLGALERKDADAARRLAGAPASSTSDDGFLVADVMADITAAEVVDVRESGDVTLVDVDYTADGRSGSVTFQVQRSGAILGLFPTWSFAASPYAEIDLTVRHARDFTVNGIRYVNPVQDVATTYLAFTPGVMRFAHESTLTTAATQTIVLGSPEVDRYVDVDVQANEAFVSLVAEQTRAYLDACATQQVFFPVGCPFGQAVPDPKLESLPSWSIVAYPEVQLVPTTTPGEWTVGPTTGVARLQVEVIDTYDGSVYPYDAEVSFAVGFVATFVGTAEVVVTPQL